jgi:hypothetical protein
MSGVSPQVGNDQARLLDARGAYPNYTRRTWLLDAGDGVERLEGSSLALGWRVVYLVRGLDVRHDSLEELDQKLSS